MKIFEANISQKVADSLAEHLKNIDCFEIANQKIHQTFGILSFFENDEDLATLKIVVSTVENIVNEVDRAEYGDFQTNIDLANNAVLYLVDKSISPQILIEPTCGKGNFLLAALQHFSGIEHIFGIEIYKPYIWETKFNIIHFFLENKLSKKPHILIAHSNVFAFDFNEIANLYTGKEILVIGNPPWVTNAKLSVLNSNNLPTKVNFKNHSGLDAMTGKGNFDIAEYITLMMLATFQKMNGNILFLVKNSVIKNVLFDQQKNKYALSEIEKLSINSKKEFNVSVEASLFYAKLNTSPTYICKEYDFYDKDKILKTKYGWLGEKFVSNLDTYIYTQTIDGKCPFEWRQGLKHDCSTVMELEKVNEYYVNGLGENISLEEGLVYGMLKSSDLKNTVIAQTRKYTIVTQKKVGEKNDYIQSEYPKTYQYLTKHKASFEARKSVIYRNKPTFSIFGIGDYSFKPYKIAISGLYKTLHFTLILLQNEKPVMLDDTCYFMSFDKLEFAVYTLILLNSEKAAKFLQSITFADAKRTFTKDILMRIDITALAKIYDEKYMLEALHQLNEKYALNLNLALWDSFLSEITPHSKTQMLMFE